MVKNHKFYKNEIIKDIILNKGWVKLKTGENKPKILINFITYLSSIKNLSNVSPIILHIWNIHFGKEIPIVLKEEQSNEVYSSEWFKLLNDEITILFNNDEFNTEESIEIYSYLIASINSLDVMNLYLSNIYLPEKYMKEIASKLIEISGVNKFNKIVTSLETVKNKDGLLNYLSNYEILRNDLFDQYQNEIFIQYINRNLLTETIKNLNEEQLKDFMFNVFNLSLTLSGKSPSILIKDITNLVNNIRNTNFKWNTFEFVKFLIKSI